MRPRRKTPRANTARPGQRRTLVCHDRRQDRPGRARRRARWLATRAKPPRVRRRQARGAICQRRPAVDARVDDKVVASSPRPTTSWVNDRPQTSSSDLGDLAVGIGSRGGGGEPLAKARVFTTSPKRAPIRKWHDYEGPTAMLLSASERVVELLATPSKWQAGSDYFDRRQEVTFPLSEDQFSAGRQQPRQQRCPAMVEAAFLSSASFGRQGRSSIGRIRSTCTFRLRTFPSESQPSAWVSFASDAPAQRHLRCRASRRIECMVVLEAVGLVKTYGRRRVVIMPLTSSRRRRDRIQGPNGRYRCMTCGRSSPTRVG